MTPLLAPPSPRLSLRVAASALVTLAAWTLLAAPAPAHAQQQPPARDPAEARARALVQELKASRGSIAGLGAAAELARFVPWMDHDAAADVLAGAAKARPHPYAAALIDRERAQHALSSGDRAQAQRLIHAQGFLTDWLVLGPFPNDGMGGFDAPYAPEQRLDPAAPAKGRNGPTPWRRLQDRDLLGTNDLETLIRPVESSVAYAAAVVQSDRDRDALLHITASSAYTVWLGGGRVASQRDALGGQWDRDAYGVRLRRGPNVVLLKLASDGGPLAFSLRFTDPKANPLPKNITASGDPDALTAALPANPGEGLMFPSTPTPTTPAKPPLQLAIDAAQALKPAPPEPRAHALARAAYLARLYRPDDPAEPALELLREARALAATVAVEDLAADLMPQHWQQREAADNALSASPRDPWLRYRSALLAARSAGDAGGLRAATLVRALLQDHPGFVAAHVLDLELLLDEGLFDAATTRALALLKRHPRHVALVKIALEVSAPLQTRAADQLDLYAKRLTLDAGSIGAYGAYASLLLQAGRADDARAVVQKALAVRPDVTGFYGLVADVERSAGRLDLAEAALRTLTDLVPGEASYWTRLGMFLAEQNRREAAVSALTRAVELQPQNIQIKDYLEYIAPQGPRVDETFALDFEPLDPADERARFAAEDYYYAVDQKITQVYPNGLSSTFVQRAVKVLTDTGVEAMRAQYITYTPGSELVDVRQVRVIRPDGSVRETYQLGEQAVSEPWYNLYYDVRAMVLYFPDLSPGDTLELRYRISQTSTTNIFGDYFGDLWFAQDTAPKLNARYTLLLPPGRTVSTRTPKLPHDLSASDVTTPDGTLRAQTWTFRDVPAIESEANSPGLSELADYLHVSTYATWDDLAAWYWNLVKDQFILDSELERIVQQLTQGVTSRRERVRLVHNWVVQNTRYVGLEFGIHGYKPYRTTQVFRRRFGDCKDKASLLKVMLEAADIPANIVLVRTRNNAPIDPQPPSLNIFDHAISYVPEFDLYLDGTAEYSGTDELPFGDQGVQVLIVKDGGGYTFTTTPVYPHSTNTLTATMNVALTADPKRAPATVKASLVARGAFAATYRQRYQTPSSRTELFTASLNANFPGATLAKLDVSPLTKLELPVTLDYAFTSPSLTTAPAPNTLRFLPLFYKPELTQQLAPRTSRTLDLLIGHPYTSTQTYTIALPPKHRLDDLPTKPIVRASPFGSFSLHVTQSAQPQGNTAVVVSALTFTAHRVKAADYPAFRAWLESIDALLNTPLTSRAP